MFNCTNSEGLLSNFQEVPKEGTDIVLRLIAVNSVYYLYLLPVLPHTKATYVIRLKEVCLIGRKLYYPDLIHKGLKPEVGGIMAGCSIN